MSTTLQFTVTDAGAAAAWNADNTGTEIALTHIQLGSGNKVPVGDETALLSPQQKAAIGAGFRVSDTQIRMSAIFGGASAFTVREVGVWVGDPDAGGILFGYWSQSTGDLAVKSAGVDLIFTHDMILDAAIPPGSVTVTVDTAQDALIAAHEAASDPHPQYLLKITYASETVKGIAEIATQGETDAGVDDERIVTPLKLSMVMQNHLAASNPHPQYPTSGWLLGYGRVGKDDYQDITSSGWVDVAGLSINIPVTQAPVNVDVSARISVHFDNAPDPAFARLIISGGEHGTGVEIDKCMEEGLAGYTIGQSFILDRMLPLGANTTYTLKAQVRNSVSSPGQDVRINASDENRDGATADSLCILSYKMFKG
jgi:hypothetical protein